MCETATDLPHLPQPLHNCARSRLDRAAARCAILRTNVCTPAQKKRTQVVDQIILGIDPGLANTGWGVIEASGSKLRCLAYGCVSTPASQTLAERLKKIHEQIGAVIAKFHPTALGIETVWFGENVTAAFATGQARGVAILAAAEAGMSVDEFSPSQIKLSVVGVGSADKAQVQYMVAQLLDLDAQPEPDHAADALAAAICVTTHNSILAG